jgi:cholesterol oxidase
MASFDYDVVIIGPGFGGSVGALRALEKGYRVGVMQAGNRWRDEDATGADITRPASEPLNTYEVQEVDDSMEIRGRAPQSASPHERSRHV